MFLFCHSISSFWPRNLSGVVGYCWDRAKVVVELGEGVKTGDQGALKHNTIVIVLIPVSMATIMQCFSLSTSHGLLLCSACRYAGHGCWPPLCSAQRLGGCLCNSKLVEGLLGNWREVEKQLGTSLCNYIPMEMDRCCREVFHQGTKRLSLKWWWELVLWAVMFLLVLWQRSCQNENNITNIGDPSERHSWPWMYYFYFKFYIIEGLYKLHSKNRLLQ